MRVGVVGCGYWGMKHLRVLSAMPQVSEAVIVEPDGATRRRAGEAFPNAPMATSLADAMDRVDAVVIATPARTHAHLARVALQEGKHVLVEKPMATSASDAAGLTRLADEVGRTLMVGHTFEHHRAVQSVRNLIRTGELGTMRYLTSARLNLGLYQPDVNVIWDLAPHDVSILNFVLDSVPHAVTSWGWAHASGELEDVAYLDLQYDNGVTAQVHVSWLDPCKVRRMTIVGSERMAVYDDLMPVDDKVRVFDRAVLPASAATGGKVAYRDGDQWSHGLSMREPLLVQDEQFVDCVKTGRRPTADGRSGLAVTATLEAAERSLREKRTVRLDEVLVPTGTAERSASMPAGSR